MKKKIVLGLCAACFVLSALVSLVSCAKGALKDGVYSGKSSTDDRGDYGEVTFTVSAGKITECRFVTWQKDGSIKDEDYGKVNGAISNADYYAKAQLAVRAMDHYARELVEKQDVNKIDAVSGATNSYNQFDEAVDDALK